MNDLKPLPPLIRWFPQETDDIYDVLLKAVAWGAILSVAFYASFTLGRSVTKGEAITALREARGVVAGALADSEQGKIDQREVENRLTSAVGQVDLGIRNVLRGYPAK